MIKGRLVADGGPILLLGLSRENVNRLLDDKPIMISADELAQMGLPDNMAILLIGGESEAQMSAALGGLPLQPEVAGQRFTQRPNREGRNDGT